MQVHQPVMPNEVIEQLCLKETGIYLDMTVGAGGHSSLIAQKISNKGKILGIDQDSEILQYAQITLQQTNTPFQLFQSPFSKAHHILQQNNIPKIDGVLLDLGVSSYQLSAPLRGFSFQTEGPLDMRMSSQNPITAAKILETYSQKQLEKIFFEWGEESQSRKIAQKIVERRVHTPFLSTLDLASFIAECYGFRRGKIHPATKIFQALRIEVNNEMEELQQALTNIIPYLNVDARIVIITFHSLEDRIVKQYLKKHEKELQIITNKPILPTQQEIRMNPRSRSAKIRVAQKRDY
ncbi:MAG: 16S rRNA (cytosine(1402)-N(4))-methyltransferase RsmH [Planctomycetes bacterium]|jgi:16S rRNA (cytosine1402-N4)-methyltransferase|nr:16S rRNA (cytosine(1402)-N(4))-methyltransferase RsmH [Planctomycetota bacterium]HPY74949.1 16S rRNA (cytosine(1402)-N(4))-methyltransferase RsmH [Planctomycetota bacterium]HQB00641.1 16S rRNA (cytosine(1402)-N(4))-methyltransferase RsmH [Planctomycetota bacterium]